MNETSLSLLDSLRASENALAWQRLVDLYGPLIRGYLRRQQLAEQDVEDVTQEVLLLVARKVGNFERQDQTGSFRSWLRKITLNRLREHFRSDRRRPKPGGSSQFVEMLEQLADPKSPLSQVWDEEHDRHVLQYLCRQIRPQFSERTWDAFFRLAMRNEEVGKVAAELEMTVNACQIAKSRVLSKLREQGRGLLQL